MKPLQRLAELIEVKNKFEEQISHIIGRPALIGHVGEYIASQVFDIRLEESAAHKGSDGSFSTGPLADRTVNIKWYAKRENLLDITPETLPDCYLVLAGPKSSPASSRGTVRPWTIDSVFLFDSRELVSALRHRGVEIGVAASVADHLWEGAEIYPRKRNPALPLSPEQRSLLKLYGGNQRT